LGSRRGCEELMRQGRVTVGGKVVRELGTRVDPTRVRIAVDGEPVRMEPIVYFAVNKPKGYVTTNYDPAGRPRVVDLLPEIPERVYAVGRLDEDSTGLIILTNDGELANRLTHPRFGVEKLYRAQVAGEPCRETLAKLTEGIWLFEGKVRAQRVRVIRRQGHSTILELVLSEGRNREIRRMLANLGHKVMSLNRVAVGPITLKGLPVGECRRLSRFEVDLLHKVASGPAQSVAHFSEAGTLPRRQSRHERPRPRPRPAQAAATPG
jgi:23S rRNA pseudouridine2605 synthase